MSQEDLAGEAGVNRSFLAGIELGNQNPTVRILIKIASVLKVTVSQLFE
jgi:transcriptional regulator with XRE-family HTH domain